MQTNDGKIDKKSYKVINNKSSLVIHIFKTHGLLNTMLSRMDIHCNNDQVTFYTSCNSISVCCQINSFINKVHDCFIHKVFVS